MRTDHEIRTGQLARTPTPRIALPTLGGRLPPSRRGRPNAPRPCGGDAPAATIRCGEQLKKPHPHEVAPGLTGWAQVNGRNGLSWDEKFRLDVWYVENLSLWLDIRIILRTAIGTLTREGISGGPDGTTQRFTPSTGAALGERDPASVLPGEATGDS